MPSAENANARSGNPWPRQQPSVAGIAALRRRIARVELRLHEAEDRRRQAGLERTARRDRPGRRCGLRRYAAPSTVAPASRAAAGDQHGREPPPTAVRDLTGHDQHRRHHQQREAGQIVERQPERDEYQDECRELHPGLSARAVSSWIDQCRSPNFRRDRNVPPRCCRTAISTMLGPAANVEIEIPAEKLPCPPCFRSTKTSCPTTGSWGSRRMRA